MHKTSKTPWISRPCTTLHEKNGKASNHFQSSRESFRKRAFQPFWKNFACVAIHGQFVTSAVFLATEKKQIGSTVLRAKYFPIQSSGSFCKILFQGRSLLEAFHGIILRGRPSAIKPLSLRILFWGFGRERKRRRWHRHRQNPKSDGRSSRLSERDKTEFVFRPRNERARASR